MPEQRESLDPQDPAYRGRVQDPNLKGALDFTDIGFAAAGSAFGGGDPNAAAAWRQAGQNITGVLQERWFRKEFESFNDQYLQPYVEHVQSVGNSIVEKFGQADSGTIMGPDGTSVQVDPNTTQVARMKSNWLAAHVGEISKATDSLLQKASKYGSGNPLIAARVNDILQAHTEQISMLTNPAQLIAGEQGFAKTGLIQAESGTEIKKPGLIEAQTKDTLAHARYMDRMPQDSSGSESKALFNDPIRYLDQNGVDATIGFMGAANNQWMTQLRAQEQAKIEQDIREKAIKDRKFGTKAGFSYDEKGSLIDTPSDEKKFSAMIESRNDEALQKATLSAAKVIFNGRPEVMRTLASRSEYSQWMDKEEIEAPAEALIQGIMTDDEVDDLVESNGPVLIQEIDKAFRTGQIKTEKEVMEYARKIIEENTTHAGTLAARRQAKEAGQKLLEYVGANWGNSPTARKVTGTPTLFEKIEKTTKKAMSGARKASEAKSRGLIY